MENLAGIRKLYRRGNGQGAAFRGGTNSRMFGETQRQIDYKEVGRNSCVVRESEGRVLILL